MKFFKLTTLTILFILASFSVLSAMGGKPEDIPLKASKIKFEDGEYLRIGTYVSGEKTEESYIVSRIDTNKNRVEVYWQTVNLNRKQKLPGHYTDYNTYRFTIDLETGSPLSVIYQNPLTDDKGNIRSSDILSEDKSEIQSDSEYWDGYELKKIHSKIPLRKGYPIILHPLTVFYTARFLDISSPGIAYLCWPQILKQPIPLSFIFLGRETVKTPAGEIKTIKVHWNVSDPFLAKLMQPYMNESFIWVEDSPRRLVVKAMNPSAQLILEEVSTIKEKNME